MFQPNVNPSPPGLRRTVTWNQMSFQFLIAYRLEYNRPVGYCQPDRKRGFAHEKNYFTGNRMVEQSTPRTAELLVTWRFLTGSRNAKRSLQ